VILVERVAVLIFYLLCVKCFIVLMFIKDVGMVFIRFGFYR